VLPAQSQQVFAQSPKLAKHIQQPNRREVPGLRHIAVKEYSDCQQSQVRDEFLKAGFIMAGNAILEDGLDLEC
jgi:hypothetical protein